MGDPTSFGGGPHLKFSKDDFMLAPQRYQRLLYLLATDAQCANSLAVALGMGVDLDIYSKLISNFFNMWDRNLVLINWCIEAEFKNNPNQQAGSLMRGNTFLSKLESDYARRHGSQYLKLLFGDLVKEVITSEQSFDIDKSRGQISESILQDRIIKLKLIAQRFFARMTSEDMRKKMPRVIRAIAGLTRIHARKYYPNTPSSPLIGGFIMLRFFAPALVTPEAFGLSEEVPTAKARSNLIIIAKVLQNISNGLTFETTKKEQHMKPLDDFVSAQFKLMDLYYQSIADDPEIPVTSLIEPFSDLISKPITMEMIQIDKIGLPDLFLLHRLIDRFKSKFLSVLKKGNESSNSSNNNSNGANNSSILMDNSLISNCSNTSQSNPPTSPRNNNTLNNNSYVSNAGDWQTGYVMKLLQELGPPPSIQSSSSRSASQPTPLVPAAILPSDFVYQGRTNKAGHAVFYVTVCKIDLHLDLDAILNSAISYITSNSTSSTQLCLVLDMSWSNTHEIKRKFFQQNKTFMSLQERIPHDLKKRIREIHLVHPSNVNQFMMFFFRTFVSKKFFAKVHEHEKWKTLGDWIDPSKIDLLDESKSYITKAYRVIKVNAKGKKQHRIVKFTDNSILNIDPSSGMLKNEKLLDDIEGIALDADGTIVLTFSTDSAVREAGKRKKSILGQFAAGMKDNADLATRTYVCANKTDAERFMEDVFEAAYRAQKIREPLQYKVIKVNDVGKHQERTFKITCDSLLNLDGDKIRTEISFVGIKQLDCDKNDQRVLWMQLKNEFGPRKIIFNDTAERTAMFHVLGARILQANGMEDDEQAQMKFEAALLRVGREADNQNGPGLSHSNSGHLVIQPSLSSSSSNNNNSLVSTPSSSPSTAASTPLNQSGGIPSSRAPPPMMIVPPSSSLSMSSSNPQSPLTSSDEKPMSSPSSPGVLKVSGWGAAAPSRHTPDNVK